MAQLIHAHKTRDCSTREILNEEQIQQFIETGILVIPSIISEEELLQTREGFHEYLRSRGCDPANLEETAGNLASLSSTGGSGGVLDVFYEGWKLALNEHPRVISALGDIWQATYSPQIENFSHPFETFNPRKAHMYIDRVCFRVPSILSTKFGKSKKLTLQRSLTPHLDCCPHKMYTGNKWRPVQAFIALTDTTEPNQGGFEACAGHHRNFAQWAATREGTVKANYTSSSSNGGETVVVVDPPPCVGEFTPIRMKEDRAVIDGFAHVPIRAGDMVCWDYRIPHANARFNNASWAREAVYIGLLPDIELNRNYSAVQRDRIQSGQVPDDQWHDHSIKQTCSYEFSARGKELLGMANVAK